MHPKIHARYFLATGLAALGAVLVEALAPAGALGHYQWSAPALIVVTWLLHAVATKTPPTAAAALILASAFMVNGCWLFKPSVGPTPPADGGTVVDCEEAALHQAALSVLPAVENALASDNYEQALAAIVASTAGPLALESVECAVLWVSSQAAEQAPDSLEATKRAHGTAWLAKLGAKFKGGS